MKKNDRITHEDIITETSKGGRTYLVHDFEQGTYYIDAYQNDNVYRTHITQEVYEAMCAQRKSSAKE